MWSTIFVFLKETKIKLETERERNIVYTIFLVSLDFEMSQFTTPDDNLTIYFFHIDKLTCVGAFFGVFCHQSHEFDAKEISFVFCVCFTQG